MADVELTTEDPDKDLKERVSKPSGSIFITNRQIEEGDTQLARLIILLKVRRENDDRVVHMVTEMSTGVLVTWLTTDKKRAPEA